MFKTLKDIFRCYGHMALLLYHTNSHIICLFRVVDSTHIHFQHYEVLLLTFNLRRILFFTLIYLMNLGLEPFCMYKWKKTAFVVYGWTVDT
jgi:hypothetical protein